MNFNTGDRVRISISEDWYHYQEYNNETGVVTATDEESDQVWVYLDKVDPERAKWGLPLSETFRAKTDMVTLIE